MKPSLQKLFLLSALAAAFSGAVYFLLREEQREILGMQNAAISSYRKISPVAKEIRLLFVGDIMLSRGIEAVMKREGNRLLYFEKVKSRLEEADLLFGNLESPVSGRGRNIGSIYSFRTDPRSLEGLTFAGFDVVSIANNHIWDYGKEAFLDTLSHLTEAGIAYAGGGKEYTEAHRPVVLEAEGSKVAFLAYTNLLPGHLFRRDSRPAVAGISADEIRADIAKAKELAPLVVVSFHWGDEYSSTPNDFQQEIGRTAIDAGARLVIGHHPHTVEHIERYKGGYIAYSLGNFIFDQNFDEFTSSGLLLDVVARGGEIISVSKQEVHFNEIFQPYFPAPAVIISQ